MVIKVTIQKESGNSLVDRDDENHNIAEELENFEAN
jgi:hypothetical protein